MGLISLKVHGYIDWASIIIMLIAPTLFGYSTVPALVSYGAAALELGSVLSTDYPAGKFKLIPLSLHLNGEVLIGLGAFALPWIFGFADETAPRNMTFLIAAITLINPLITKKG